MTWIRLSHDNPQETLTGEYFGVHLSQLLRIRVLPYFTLII